MTDSSYLAWGQSVVVKSDPNSGVIFTKVSNEKCLEGIRGPFSVRDVIFRIDVEAIDFGTLYSDPLLATQ
jgi:hypothetical protein